MMKKLPDEPQAQELAPSNVAPLQQKPEPEIDDENYRILSVLLVNEFAKFKGRPIL